MADVADSGLLPQVFLALACSSEGCSLGPDPAEVSGLGLVLWRVLIRGCSREGTGFFSFVYSNWTGANISTEHFRTLCLLVYERDLAQYLLGFLSFFSAALAGFYV